MQHAFRGGGTGPSYWEGCPEWCSVLAILDTPPNVDSVNTWKNFGAKQSKTKNNQNYNKITKS